MNSASGSHLPPDDTSGYLPTTGSRATVRDANVPPIPGVRRVLLVCFQDVQFQVAINPSALKPEPAHQR